MAQQDIINSETGLLTRTKLNQNFDELYDFLNSFDDVVIVKSEDDFPAPVSGISTLEEKTYLIAAVGVVPVSFRLKHAFSRTVVTGLGRLFSTLEFTATSALPNIINDPDISVSLTDLIVHSPNAPMFGLVGGNNSILTISDCVLDNCADLGTSTGFIRTQINNGTLIGFTVTGGLEFLGSNATIIINDVQSAANVATPTFTMNDAGFSCNNLSLKNITATLLTGTNKFADIDPTKVTQGLVADSAFTSTSPLGTAIDNTTKNFIVNRVQGVEDTRKIGTVRLSSPLPLTVATTTMGLKVEIQGTWVGSNLSQFELLTNGIRFLGLGPADIFEVTVVITGDRVGGTGSDTYEGIILLDDVEVSDSVSQSSMSDKGGTIELSTFTTLAELKHITASISNETGTAAIDITSSKIKLRRAF